MGKRPKKQRRIGLPPPDWFATRFDRPSEWATLRVPEEQAIEWLVGATRLLNETPLWRELIAVQEPFLRQIRRRDWSAVSPWRLVHHLKVLGDILAGIESFLPEPYRRWPLEVRQGLYLTIFLTHGAEAIEENPQEDFGLPEVASWPPEARTVIPAARPLWHLLAQPAIVAAIRFHCIQHEGSDAGLLALLHEGQGEGERRLMPLLGETPGELLTRLVACTDLKKADLNYRTGPQGNIPSQAFFALHELQGEQSAPEVLARALMGEYDNWLDLAEEQLHAERRKDRREEPVSEAFRIRFEYQDEPRSGEIGEAELPAAEPTALDRLIARQDETARAQMVQRIRDFLRNPKLNNKLRHHFRLLLQNPAQSEAALARQLGVIRKTVRNNATKLRKLLKQN
jgi:hypothetical protein